MAKQTTYLRKRGGRLKEIRRGNEELVPMVVMVAGSGRGGRMGGALAGGEWTEETKHRARRKSWPPSDSGGSRGVNNSHICGPHSLPFPTRGASSVPAEIAEIHTVQVVVAAAQSERRMSAKDLMRKKARALQEQWASLCGQG